MAADITITNVALPTIAEDLDASMSSLQWVVDSYNIAVAGLLLLGAGMGERFSRKWVFLSGVAAFLAGSVIAGVAPDVGWLVAARSVMGVGGALALAPAFSLIAAMYPPDQRARAIAAWAASGSLGLALSPVAAGAILSIADWHWVFLINVPLMVAAIALGAVALPPGGSPDAARLDLVGAVLSVVGLGLLLGAVIEGPAQGWTSPVIIVSAVAGAAATVSFVLWELHVEHPMFQVRVLARRGVAGASVALFAAFGAFTGIVFLVSQELQVVLGFAPAQLGLSLVPFALGLWASSHWASALAHRWGDRLTLGVGLLLMTCAFGLLAASSSWESGPAMIACTVVASLGCGLVIPIGSVMILNDLPPALTGSASGTSMLARFAGASFGVAILGTVLAMSLSPGSAHADPDAFAQGVRVAYLAGAGLVALLTAAQWIALRGTSTTPRER